jgi:hypothetical protein
MRKCEPVKGHGRRAAALFNAKLAHDPAHFSAARDYPQTRETVGSGAMGSADKVMAGDKQGAAGAIEKCAWKTTDRVRLTILLVRATLWPGTL